MSKLGLTLIIVGGFLLILSFIDYAKAASRWNDNEIFIGLGAGLLLTILGVAIS